MDIRDGDSNETLRPKVESYQCAWQESSEYIGPSHR